MTELAAMPRYEAYKDSGVEWLGEIPEHWEVNRLKAFIKTLDSGVSVNASESEVAADGDIGVLKTSCVYQYSFNPLENKKVFENEIKRVNCPVKAGSIIISRMNAPELVGASGFVKKDHDNLFLPDRLWQTSYRNEHSFSPEWLSKVLVSTRFRGVIETLATGTSPSMKNITKGDFLGIYVATPSREEQIAIASFIRKKQYQIDQAVAIKEKQIELLKERRQILIQNTVTRGLDPQAPVRDSGVEWIGEIPAHWEIKRLRLLGTTQNGISAGAEYFGSGFPFVGYGDVYKNRELPKAVKGLAESPESDRKQYSVKKGDVFFTRTSETVDEIAFTSVCMQTMPDATFSGFLIRFRPTSKQLTAGYSKYYFSAKMLRSFFVGEMNLVTRASLSQELLKSLPVLLPPDDEQIRIFEFIESESGKINKAITLQQQQIHKLKEYRATLINRAVTGKIKIV